MEMNYCRRCGAKFTDKNNHIYKCSNNHTIYANSSPAVAIILTNQNGDVVVTKRATEPKKGLLDLPGGYCDGPENLEDAIERELQEELGLAVSQYTKPSYLCSYIDYYDYADECLPFLSTIFTAQLTEEVAIQANDDVEDAYFVPAKDIDANMFCFSNVQKAFNIYLNKLKD